MDFAPLLRRGTLIKKYIANPLVTVPSKRQWRRNSALAPGCAVKSLSETQNDVLVITMQQMKTRNAFSKSFLSDFEACTKAALEQKARAVVLQSTVPRVFCAGADLKERAAMPDESVAPFVARLRDALSSFAKLPCVTVAVIEGAALGGGMELALACDMRISGPDARFGLPETKLAIFPGAGGTQRLPRVVGLAHALDLILTGRIIDATEAKRISLISAVSQTPYEDAIKIATNIAEQNGPIGVQYAKELVHSAFGTSLYVITSYDEVDPPFLPALILGSLQPASEQGLIQEGKYYERLVPTSDRREGLHAFIEKRSPKYRGD